MTEFYVNEILYEVQILRWKDRLFASTWRGDWWCPLELGSDAFKVYVAGELFFRARGLVDDAGVEAAIRRLQPGGQA